MSSTEPDEKPREAPAADLTPDERTPDERNRAAADELLQDIRKPTPVLSRQEWEQLPTDEQAQYLSRGGQIRDLNEDERRQARDAIRKEALAKGGILRSQWDKLSPREQAEHVRQGKAIVD